MEQQVRTLQAEVRSVNERFNTIDHELQELTSGLEKFLAAGGSPAPEAAEDNGLSDSAAKAPDSAEPVVRAPHTPLTVPVGVSPQQMFDSAYDDFTSARYDTAIKRFELFIQTFPRLPQAADAQFNIGASYYNQNKWNEARDAFLLVTTRYPQAADSNAQAFFKLGQTYEQLNQVDAAKKAYETVVQKSPASFQANLASQATQRLSKR